MILESGPTGPNQVLVGDITYVPLSGGKWAYLATWLDLFARKLVGWRLDTHMRAEIVLKALQKAEGRRNLTTGAIAHSDQGSQYASAKFRKHLAKRGYRQSMSRKGDCYDNAFAESFFSRLKGELLQDGIFDTFEDAFTEIFNYIECNMAGISPKFSKPRRPSLILKFLLRPTKIWLGRSPDPNT
ncbi:MAG: IS3 family transposase [Lewinellaceae bacterium]|nr:IS3 family transposase [Lewinellaceae bacterium]